MHPCWVQIRWSKRRFRRRGFGKCTLGEIRSDEAKGIPDRECTECIFVVTLDVTLSRDPFWVKPQLLWYTDNDFSVSWHLLLQEDQKSIFDLLSLSVMVLLYLQHFLGWHFSQGIQRQQFSTNRKALGVGTIGFGWANSIRGYESWPGSLRLDLDPFHLTLKENISLNPPSPSPSSSSLRKPADMHGWSWSVPTRSSPWQWPIYQAYFAEAGQE